MTIATLAEFATARAWAWDRFGLTYDSWQSDPNGDRLSSLTGSASSFFDRDRSDESAYDAFFTSGVERRAPGLNTWLDEVGYVSQTAVAPVVEIGPETTFDAYHPSMLPMIEKLSEAANDAGYCQEYDRMARSIGAPTRAEVRRLVVERDGREYKVRIPVTVFVDTTVHALSEDEARDLVAGGSFALPGTSENLTAWDRSSQSWVGLRQAVRAVVGQDEGYPRNDEMRYDGTSSFVVTEI